jgi:uncharacterized membrane protein YfhO
MENPNRLVVSVQANAPGYVVVSDVWYPGWRVTVNEQETEILRANYLFRAVAVPAGESQVIFSYEPISFSLGAVISLLTLIVVLLLMYRQR